MVVRVWGCTRRRFALAKCAGSRRISSDGHGRTSGHTGRLLAQVSERGATAVGHFGGPAVGCWVPSPRGDDQATRGPSLSLGILNSFDFE